MVPGGDSGDIKAARKELATFTSHAHGPGYTWGGSHLFGRSRGKETKHAQVELHVIKFYLLMLTPFANFTSVNNPVKM